ncbi:MAG: Putative hydrolase [Candidatus Tokpelaia hoelldobleri]|uniref:Hydrolase n=1 Tax=Candidatus Tokpelaia hoelldobleri TaxID=1902579 RepID=A0A1U9JSP9_9HYPH|nr:MAG: Putative hydrolase [Candidatus Tokpelaia hoelldoblerii]
MDKKTRIALAQIQSTTDKAANIIQVEQAISAAAHENVDLLVFPEAAQVSFEARLHDVAEPLDGAFATILRAAAKQHNMLIVAGMFEPAANGRVRNSLLITGAGVEAVYHKIHLYDAFGSKESASVEAGTEHVTVETAFGTIGFATCYDVRFADQFSALARKGAEIIVLPASWADGPGKAEQWDLLTRARAADSQSWLLACDQAWQPPKGTAALGLGRSAVIDPTGTVRARLSAAPGLLVSDIDLAMVKDIRTRIPILQD